MIEMNARKTSRGKRRVRGLVSICAVLTLALTACTSGGGGSDDNEPAKGTDKQIAKLTWGVKSAARSLDNQHAFDSDSRLVTSVIAEPLVTVNSSGKLVGVLATEWKQSDATTLVFTIREGVKFWNGDPLTADDVEWSLSRNMDPKTASEMATQFVDVEAIKATGPQEVTITFKKPSPEFIYSSRNTLIYQKSFAVAAGSDFGGAKAGVMATGPYKVEKYSPTSGTTLTRSDTYWGKKPTIKTIELKPIADAETLRLAVQSGDVDGTFKLPLSNIKAWKGLTNAKVGVGAGPTTMMLVLDTHSTPFSDIHARRAVAYTLDRAGIAKALYGGEAEPANSMSTPVGWANVASPAETKKFFSSLPQLSLDLKKAKDELSQSATPDGFALTLLVPSGYDEGLTGAMQTLKENASKIGIDITLKEVPVANWLSGLRGKKKAPMGVVPIGPAAPTPLSLVASLLESDEFMTYAPEDVLTQINEYKASLDPKEQLEISKEVVRRMSEDMPVVPIIYPNVAYALNKKYVYSDSYSGWSDFGEDWTKFIRSAS